MQAASQQPEDQFPETKEISPLFPTPAQVRKRQKKPLSDHGAIATEFLGVKALFYNTEQPAFPSGYARNETVEEAAQRAQNIAEGLKKYADKAGADIIMLAEAKFCEDAIRKQFPPDEWDVTFAVEKDRKGQPRMKKGTSLPETAQLATAIITRKSKIERVEVKPEDATKTNPELTQSHVQVACKIKDTNQRLEINSAHFQYANALLRQKAAYISEVLHQKGSKAAAEDAKKAKTEPVVRLLGADFNAEIDDRGTPHRNPNITNVTPPGFNKKTLEDRFGCQGAGAPDAILMTDADGTLHHLPLTLIDLEMGSPSETKAINLEGFSTEQLEQLRKPQLALPLREDKDLDKAAKKLQEYKVEVCYAKTPLGEWSVALYYNCVGMEHRTLELVTSLGVALGGTEQVKESSQDVVLSFPKEKLPHLEKTLEDLKLVNFQAFKKITDALELAKKSDELKGIFPRENQKAFEYLRRGDIENYKLQIFRLLYASSLIKEKMVKPNILYEAGILTSVMGNRPVFATTAIKAVLEAPIEKIKKMSLLASNTGRAFESLRDAGITTPTKGEAKASAEKGDLSGLYKFLQIKLNEKVPHQRQIICLYFTIALLTANTEFAQRQFKVPQDVIVRMNQEAKAFFGACSDMKNPKLGKSDTAPQLKTKYKEFAQTLNAVISDSSTSPLVAKIYKDPNNFQLLVLALLHNRTDKSFSDTIESTNTFDNYLQGIINLKLWDTQLFSALQTVDETPELLSKEKQKMYQELLQATYASHFTDNKAAQPTPPPTAYFDAKDRPGAQQPSTQAAQQPRPPTPKGSGNGTT